MTWVGRGQNYIRGILKEKGLHPPLPLYLSRGRIHHHRLCHRPRSLCATFSFIVGLHPPWPLIYLLRAAVLPFPPPPPSPYPPQR
jgi:hypothetical protein